jgi:peptidyl-prolyl cis-trans isomerase A (cyclophilin A)
MNLLNKIVKPLLLISTAIFSLSSQATIVQMETNLGPIQINLYDEQTPATVANFLNYLNDGDYSNAIFHRSVNNFVIQGGGFAYNGTWPAEAIATNPVVINEPVFSNIRGTIGMAKGSAVNSATNQWFINLSDSNSALDLDTNNAFTVFGEVVDGMSVVDEISNITTFNEGGAFKEIPLQSYDGTNDPNETNLMIISSINIIDATVNSAANLNPTLTTRQEVTPTTPSSSGGGSFGLFIFGLIFMGFRNRKAVRALI